MDLLTIEFSFAKPAPWNRATYETTRYPVLGASYLKYDGYGPKWSIRVESVPRPLKHQIQTKLMDEALPKIRAWLVANAKTSGRDGGHHLTFFFDELANEL